jgi:multidrug transporter EmrE-like cation transporter
MWAWKPVQDLAIHLSQSLAYAVFVGIAYPVLTIFGVTLLSLPYRFFAVPSEGTPSKLS